MKKATGFEAKAVGGRTRGCVVRAREAFRCYGAGAYSYAHGRHEIAAGTAYFRFTKHFHYGGALYTRGSTVCMDHAIEMGVAGEAK